MFFVSRLELLTTASRDIKWNVFELFDRWIDWSHFEDAAVRFRKVWWELQTPFLTFYRSKWFKDARHESPSWRDCVACLINVSMRRSRTWGRLSGLVNTLKNSCIDSLWVFGKSCVLHFPVGVFGDEDMGLSLPFCFPPHLSACYSQSPILHYTCTLCCFLSPICSLHSPLSNKRMRWEPEKQTTLSIYSKQRKVRDAK